MSVLPRYSTLVLPINKYFGASSTATPQTAQATHKGWAVWRRYSRQKQQTEHAIAGTLGSMTLLRSIAGAVRQSQVQPFTQWHEWRVGDGVRLVIVMC